MKRLIFLIALIFISKCLFAQSKQQIDSLKNVIATTTQDTAKVMALCALSSGEPNNEKRFSLINKALLLARKIRFEKGEAQCYNALGIYFRGMNDRSKALEYHLKALKLTEKDPHSQENYSSLIDIGMVYSLQQNHEAALAYYFKAAEILKRTNVGWDGLYLFGRIGSIYLQQKKLDSALIYYTKSYEKARKAEQYHSSSPLLGLGNVHSAMGNTELAFSYYRMSVGNDIENRRSNILPATYLALAKLFTKTSNKDSALYYGKKALSMLNERQNKAGVMNAAKLLAQLYENKDGNQAARYYKIALEATDSVFSGSKIVQIQNLSFAEQERQSEINQFKLKEAEDRKHNLQFAALAIGLITFIILFFVLSRSIIVKTKFIEFFGVLLLLAVFEFINLLIHPYLERVTHHSPVLMLLILIAIGALLIPLHHRLEKWMTHVMVEKNKKIRLEAAEKTIAELAVKQAN